MHQYLPQSLPNLSQANILVVGDVMLDRYWFGDTSRISPEAPVPIVNIYNADHRPGGAGNVALNIAALGAQVTLLGITGDDEAAHTLIQQLSSAAVLCDLEKLKEIATIIKLRVISRHQQILRLDFEKNITPKNNHFLLQHFENHLSKANVVVLSDYNKGTLTDTHTFIRMARDASLPVIVDPKGKDFSIYSHATILTPNLKEFEAVVGVCRSEQELLDKAQTLLQQYDIESILVTRGSDGMTLIQRDAFYHMPACAREVLDVTGAGDTVISALAVSYAAGCDMVSATALANLAASLVVGKLGAASVSVPELASALIGKTTYQTGLLNEEQLLQAVKEVRNKGKKIVFTNGCFDILHVGHVTCLQMAKELGDYLIVAVNTDESIKKLKGASRPINNLEHRMMVLAGLGVVDSVVAFADDTPERLLKLIKPDLLVKGGDYKLDEVVGKDIVTAYGGEVRVLNSNIASSSTNIIKRIISRMQESTTDGKAQAPC